MNSLEGKASFPPILSRSLFVQRFPGITTESPLRQMAVITPTWWFLACPPPGWESLLPGWHVPCQVGFVRH